MAYQPVPELPDDTAENVPRVMGVRADDSLALAPAGLPLTGGTLSGTLYFAGGSPDTPAQIRSSPNPGRKVLALESEEDRTSSAFLLLNGADDLGGQAAIYGGGFRNQEWYNGYTRMFGDLTVDGKINGQTVFGIADGIDTADVLDRAGTATMPVVDDEGAAATDADSITVNEIVTALMTKVKELSARIETLEQQ